jgi:hypothetical protein
MGYYLMYSPSWVEKISLCIDKGNGIVVGRQQSKKQWGDCVASSGDVLRRQVWISFFGHGVPMQRQDSENSLCQEKTCGSHK